MLRNARSILVLIPAILGLSLSACSQGPAEPSGCSTDTDCPPGNYCRHEDCVHDCVGDHECPEGFTCTARGRCERGCSVTNGGIEACDGLDNDCDGETDEGLLNRCGDCEPPDDQLRELCNDGLDNDCDGETDEGFPNLGSACDNQGCPGAWVCTADRLGEFCNAPDPQPDDDECDGVDEDCDGQTDEDASPRACPLQAGVCRGAVQVCLETGSWSTCDYGPDYTEGIDDGCDQLDNDCDEATDEDALPVLEAESGSAAGDGLDNNCNGLVDEPGGVMVKVPLYPNVWVDVYEASIFDDADCQGTRYGLGSDDYPAGWPVQGTRTETLYACSLPGVQPSGHLSWHRARWACEAQGKRLCDVWEWQNACKGSAYRMYPYGSDFLVGVCNDAWQDDGANTGSLASTGAYDLCTCDALTFDASGNLAEWLLDWDDAQPGNAMTGGGSWYCEICYYGQLCRPCYPGDPADLNDIGWSSDCEVEGRSDESYRRQDAKHYLGTRCCLDGP